MLPNLGLENALSGRKKKIPEHRVEEGVPGCFSPRPSHSRSVSMASNSQHTWEPKISIQNDLKDTLERENEKKSEKRSFIVPDETILNSQIRGDSIEGFSRSTGGTINITNEIKTLENREHSLRRSSPKMTLLDHQELRTFLLRKLLENKKKTEGSKEKISEVRNSLTISNELTLCEAYISGKSWQHNTNIQRGIIRNPSLNISALALTNSGDYVAVGDRSGRVFVMQRKIENEEEENNKEYESKKDKIGIMDEVQQNQQTNIQNSPVLKSYKFAVGRQAYTSVIDPLNSVEVTPNIQALCFLPQVGPTTYMLTANEKMPKLYKIVKVRESPSPFFAVDRLGEKGVGSLTLNPFYGSTTMAMKQVSRYALNHEYNINSLCPQVDSAQFFSADDLTVKLWCVEYPDTSIETYSLKPPFDEEAHEGICCIKNFPHEPFLLFIVTTYGTIRVVDTRQTLKWINQAPLLFKNTFYEEDNVYTSNLYDCDLSPCGRYIAGRDIMSVCLWDIRRPSLQDQNTRTNSVTLVNHDVEYDVIQRWELYPHLRQDMEQIFQGEIIDKFNVRFLNGHQLITGGFNKTLYTLDTHNNNNNNNNNNNSGIKVLQLPSFQGFKEAPYGTLCSIDMNNITLSGVDELDISYGSNTVTQLSHPLTSSNGDCCIFASSGQSLFQLAYSNISLS